MVRCERRGCSGTIEDGFCADCGLAPAGASRVAAVAANATARTSSQPVTSATGSTGSALVAGSGTVGSRSRTGSRRGGLGAGFVSLPPLPPMDPLARILDQPIVPEKRRSCGACQEKLRHETGFCPSCGAAYSFAPTLSAGTVVGGQYEVKGPIAYGGLGWIYLAQDRKLKDRWVVLKGLLDSKNKAAATVALQEREFLSAVKHPNVVSVYNFVSHGSEGFIVLEHVGGKTLAEIRKERGALPVAEAVAYVHRVLGAFAYLHENGMVYCDFKPSNVMLEDDVKLIDLGGVRRVADTEGEVYGTRGFFAPEIARGEAPTFASDLYTVARTLAVLVLDFDFSEQHAHSLPAASEAPVLARHDSLRRFLEKATRPEASRRFESADDMASQLLGVLREAAVLDGLPGRAVESELFHGDAFDLEREPAAAERPSPRALPETRLDALDPAATALLGVDPSGARRLPALERIERDHPASCEARVRYASALAADGQVDEALKRLRSVETREPGDWRSAWLAARLRLQNAEPRVAAQTLERVLSEVPGELAPKLGLAVARELAGDDAAAARLYDLVSRCDPGFVTAAFGLGRCLARRGEDDEAAAAYARVPASSSAHTAAQVALARTLLEPKSRPVGPQDLAHAAAAIEPLVLPDLARHELRSALFLKALDRLEASALPRGGTVRLLGVAAEEGELRLAAERELRLCARFAPTTEARIAFVDRANEVRPYTFV